MPTTPPNVESVTDSVSTCDMMSRALGAERLAQADLARPLADHHQHDVHDDDAADDERQRDDADEHGEDAARGLVIEVEERVRRERCRSCRRSPASGAAPPAAPPSRRPSACVHLRWSAA